MTLMHGHIISADAAELMQTYTVAAREFGKRSSCYIMKPAEELGHEFFQAIADFRRDPADPAVRVRLRYLMPVVIGELKEQKELDMAELAKAVSNEIGKPATEDFSGYDKKVDMYFSRRLFERDKANTIMQYPGFYSLSQNLKSKMNTEIELIDRETDEMCKIALGDFCSINVSRLDAGSFCLGIAPHVHRDATRDEEIIVTWRALNLPAGFIEEAQHDSLKSDASLSEILVHAMKNGDEKRAESIRKLEDGGYAKPGNIRQVYIFLSGTNGTLHYSGLIPAAERKNGMLSAFYGTNISIPAPR